MNMPLIPGSKLKRPALLTLALFLHIWSLGVLPVSARTSSATETTAANRPSTPEASWLVGVWKGLHTSCGRVLRLDGEVVAVLGVVPMDTAVGRPVRLQGRYIAESPCEELRPVFLVTVQP